MFIAWKLGAETDAITDMARANGGTVTSSMVDRAGISRAALKQLADAGGLVRAGRGVYVLPDSLEDELLTWQHRYRRGVYSHATALFLHGLTDRTPDRFHMTFPQGYNTSRVDGSAVAAHTASGGLYELGLSTARTPAGHEVAAYNPERALCDVLRPRARCDRSIAAEAFKRYARSPGRDVPLLSEYAKRLSVEPKVRSYLEVLL